MLRRLLHVLRHAASVLRILSYGNVAEGHDFGRERYCSPLPSTPSWPRPAMAIAGGSISGILSNQRTSSWPRFGGCRSSKSVRVSRVSPSMAICAACSTQGLDKLGNDYFTQGISIGRGLASSCLRRLRRPSQLMCTFLNSVPGPDLVP